MIVFILGSCSGPKKSVEEENVLASLSHIQQSLENKISYERFIELLNEAKVEIDTLKGTSENSQCFMVAVDKCYKYYATGGRACRADPRSIGPAYRGGTSRARGRVCRRAPGPALHGRRGRGRFPPPCARTPCVDRARQADTRGGS